MTKKDYQWLRICLEEAIKAGKNLDPLYLVDVVKHLDKLEQKHKV